MSTRVSASSRRFSARRHSAEKYSASASRLDGEGRVEVREGIGVFARVDEEASESDARGDVRRGSGQGATQQRFGVRGASGLHRARGAGVERVGVGRKRERLVEGFTRRLAGAAFEAAFGEQNPPLTFSRIAGAGVGDERLRVSPSELAGERGRERGFRLRAGRGSKRLPQSNLRLRKPPGAEEFVDCGRLRGRHPREEDPSRRDASHGADPSGQDARVRTPAFRSFSIISPNVTWGKRR